MTSCQRSEYGFPLLPAPARRPAGIVLGCALLVVAAGAELVHGQYDDPLDRRVDPWVIARLGGHSEALRLVSDLGEKAEMIVIIAVMSLACLTARRLNGAVLAAVGAPAASVATEKVLKPLADHLYLYSTYPSGHTTSVFALVSTAAVLMTGPPTSRVRPPARIAIVATAALIACAVALAEVALDDHRFTDTVGGAAVGIAVVLMATFVLDLPASRRLLPHAWLAQRAPGRLAGQRSGGRSLDRESGQVPP